MSRSSIPQCKYGNPSYPPVLIRHYRDLESYPFQPPKTSKSDRCFVTAPLILSFIFYCNWGGLSLSDESFPNEGARGAFAKPSRSLQEGSAKPSRSVSSRRLRGASKAPPRTLRGGLRTLRGGCTYQRFHEDASEGSRGLLEGSVDELHVPTRS